MIAKAWPNGLTANGLEGISARQDLLRRFWHAFDGLHSAQKHPHAALWGLLQEDGLGDADGLGFASSGYDSTLPRTLLAPELVEEIEHSWSGVLLPQWPDRIASEPLPFHLMADAFGPALKLWHGIGLTAWFVCEGPISRTGLPGIAAYYQREIDALDQLGCTLDSAVFTNLIAAETKLGKPKPLRQVTPEGVHLTVRIAGGGGRRSGFESVRDVITRFRRDWARQYLDIYLDARWRAELQDAADAYGAAGAATRSQSNPSKAATAAANHWFGGDLGKWPGAIGPATNKNQERISYMPRDPARLVATVFVTLGGDIGEWQRLVRGGGNRDPTKERRLKGLRSLARMSLHYVQLREVLGRLPTMREFGPATFKPHAIALSSDLSQAWECYASAIEETLRN